MNTDEYALVSSMSRLLLKPQAELTFTNALDQGGEFSCTVRCKTDEIVELTMQTWIDELKDINQKLQQEILKLKQKQADLEKSLAVVHSIFDSTAHGMIAVSLEGEILGFNQQFAKMWQIPNSLALSQKSPECLAFFENQLQQPQLFRDSLWEAKCDLIGDRYDILELKDGRVFAQYSRPQLLDDKIIGRVWSIWDITAFKQTEAKFQALADTTPANIFLFQGSDLSYINPAVEALTGYTKDELLGDFDIHQLIKHKQLDQHNGEYQEWQILAKNGEERWLACAVTTIDFLEAPMSMIAGIDITSYKQSESELRDSLEQSKQLSDLRAQFVSMLCHQLRTPLNVVSFSNSVLKRHLDDWTGEKSKPLLDRVQTAVEQLSKMLDDILFFAKAEAAKLQFDAQPLNLVRFCNEIVAQVHMCSSQNRINFVSQGSCLTAFIDKKLLEPILKNLLDNAIKYSPSGAVVDFKLSCEQETIIFQVTDRGIGIPTVDQQRLFEPFYRGSNIANLPGTGLGLSIVKTLVDLHGGHIDMKSEVGVGTTFTILLPSVK